MGSFRRARLTSGPLALLIAAILRQRFARQNERLRRCIDVNRFATFFRRTAAMPARSKPFADRFMAPLHIVAIAIATVPARTVGATLRIARFSSHVRSVLAARLSVRSAFVRFAVLATPTPASTPSTPATAAFAALFARVGICSALQADRLFGRS